MNDEQLQRLLRETVPPPDLGDDAAVEALLDAHDSDPAYGQGMLARSRNKERPQWFRNPALVAAILVLLAIPIAITAIIVSSPPSGGGGIANQNPPAGGGDDELVEISLEMPEPAFFGTPVDIKLPNLEPARSPRLSFTAPRKVHLISAGTEVTSSEPQPLLGDLAMVTDGDKAGGDGHYVELPPGHQWVQIDLGESQEIFAVALWHYHKKMRAYRDVAIQLSESGDFHTDGVTVFNNDHDNSIGLGSGRELAYIETHNGRIIDVAGVRARYVRLHSHGNTTDEMNHYTEVEVYGR